MSLRSNLPFKTATPETNPTFARVYEIMVQQGLSNVYKESPSFDFVQTWIAKHPETAIISENDDDNLAFDANGRNVVHVLSSVAGWGD